MTPQDFAFLARVLKLRSGVMLTPGRQSQLDSRLMPVARGNGFQSVGELVFALRHARDDALLTQVTQAVAAEEPSFFSDRAVFEGLAGHLVPALARAAGGRPALRVWSVGCGSGQEPYSIVMHLMENRRKLAGLRIDVVATDRCARSLQRAREGQYSQFEVQRGLPIQLLLKYFRKVGWRWQVEESVRAMVDFQLRDLLEGCDHLGAFDMIFCRNVLLCRHAADRRALLARLAARLHPGGVLVLGAAETAMAASEEFEPVAGMRGVFKRVQGGSRREPAPQPATVVPLRLANRAAVRP